LANQLSGFPWVVVQENACRGPRAPWGQRPCTETIEGRPGFEGNQWVLVREVFRGFVLTNSSIHEILWRSLSKCKLPESHRTGFPVRKRYGLAMAAHRCGIRVILSSRYNEKATAKSGGVSMNVRYIKAVLAISVSLPLMFTIQRSLCECRMAQARFMVLRP
jgi:hypothetical protein